MMLKLAYCKIPSTDFESKASKTRGNIFDSIRTLFSKGIQGDSFVRDSFERNAVKQDQRPIGIFARLLSWQNTVFGFIAAPLDLDSVS